MTEQRPSSPRDSHLSNRRFHEIAAQQRQKGALQAASIAFTSIDATPQGLADFNDLRNFTRTTQENLGVTPTDLSIDSVRLLSSPNMELAKKALGYRFMDCGGFFEPLQGISYIHDDGHDIPRLQRISTVAHEIGHELTIGLDYSKRFLREASAEKISRSFTRNFRLNRMPEEQVKIQDAFKALDGHEILDEYGHVVTERDVYYIVPGSHGADSFAYMPFPYSPEVRALETMENGIGDDATQEFWRLSMTAGSNPEAFMIDQLPGGKSEFHEIKYRAGITLP